MAPPTSDAMHGGCDWILASALLAVAAEELPTVSDEAVGGTLGAQSWLGTAA